MYPYSLGDTVMHFIITYTCTCTWGLKCTCTNCTYNVHVIMHEQITGHAILLLLPKGIPTYQESVSLKLPPYFYLSCTM